MKSETITVFTTSDGERFDNEAEASAHEAKVEASAKIDKYLADIENSRTRTRLKNVILDWEAYKTQMSLPGLKAVGNDVALG